MVMLPSSLPNAPSPGRLFQTKDTGAPHVFLRPANGIYSPANSATQQLGHTPSGPSREERRDALDGGGGDGRPAGGVVRSRRHDGALERAGQHLDLHGVGEDWPAWFGAGAPTVRVVSKLDGA